jgi:hypothetical protein
LLLTDAHNDFIVIDKPKFHIFTNLKAALQARHRPGNPLFELVDTSASFDSSTRSELATIGLARLPRPDAQDVFFDMEGKSRSSRSQEKEGKRV